MPREEKKRKLYAENGEISPILRIGVSSCLLGRRVRYDGDHRLNRLLERISGQGVVFVAVCPEAECGLGVPREPMRLVGDARSPRLVTIRGGADCTERLERWMRGRMEALAAEDLDGFV